MTVLEELQAMVERLKVISLRIEHEPELVMLDRSPTYKVAADAIQNAGIELNRHLKRRHNALMDQTYGGVTLDQAVAERMTMGAVASAVPPTKSWPTDAELAEIDRTP